MATSPKGKGASVVKEVVDTINGLGIFANEHKFLCRVAWVESKYGEAPGAYRSGYHGGIWQVNAFSSQVVSSYVIVRCYLALSRYILDVKLYSYF